MNGAVETWFSIKDISEYVSKKKNGNSVVNFPQPFWLTLFSIAFSHARAVLAIASARTKFRDYLLPIINPSEEFKKSFPGEVEFLNT